MRLKLIVDDVEVSGGQPNRSGCIIHSGEVLSCIDNILCFNFQTCNPVPHVAIL